MTDWGVFETLVFIIGFLITVGTLIIKISKVIQQNTDAVNNLTAELKELTTTNKKDHDVFYSSINTIKMDVAVLKQKHDADIHLIEEHIRKD